MSGCGYNDPEMLKAAIELAQSFSKSKGDGKGRAGGGGYGGDGYGGRKENFQPQPQRQQGRYSQVAAAPRQAWVPPVPVSRSLAPPPSRRNYNDSGDFATRRAANRSVIGNLGRDFLVSSGVKPEPPKDEKAAGNIVPVAGQVSQQGSLADKNSNGGTAQPPGSSGNSQEPNILDAFYAILDNKPSIGQEIDTLTNMLSKADINDPGTPTLDTPLVKGNVKSSTRQCTCQELDGQGKHEKTCPCHIAQEKKAKEVDGVHNNDEVKASDAKVNDTEAAPQSLAAGVDGFAHTHSRKLSPIAPIFVPRLNQDLGQAMDTDGENNSSAEKQMKGLLASQWA
ncbi:hypothetical protein ACQKWADRAFT_331187 [Trichoderma austrokoningii]